MPEIQIEGLKKLRKELKELDVKLPKEMTKLGKEGAEIVATEMRGRTPVRTGRLRNAEKASGLATGGQVTIKGLPYIKPIVFGWVKHNIRPNPFPYEALDARRAEVIEKFEKGLKALVDKSFTSGTGE